MANNDCLPQVHACVMRVTDLDSNGVPTPGADHIYTTDALTILTMTPVYVDGEEIEERNACGTVCVNYRGDDSFKRLDVEITICAQDPRLVSKLGGGTVLSPTQSGDVTRGYSYPSIGAITGNGVSIEVWAKRIDDGDLHVDWPYAWWVLPKVKNLRHGVRTFNNGAQLPVFSGQAYENPNWFNGPTNDWPSASDRVAQWIPDRTLPTVVCGPTSLAAS